MYLAVLGRQSEISLAELEALFTNVHRINNNLATFDSKDFPDINRLGGSLKIAEKLSEKPLDFLSKIKTGKITIGVSDYSRNASKNSAKLEAMKLKKILTRHSHSTRVVLGESAVLSTATSLHNGLSGNNPKKVEFIKMDDSWYRVIGVQDIDAYTRRDQMRPARDAKVGMLPPKLAQILINLCGPLPQNSTILDPFCGTGVVLQEALLMGYFPYGTDVSEKMVEFSQKNIKWISKNAFEETFAGRCRERRMPSPVKTGARTSDSEKVFFKISQGDATTFSWQHTIDAVASECYLGKPMSKIPTDLELKEQMSICKEIIVGFLKNLSAQIEPNTPVVVAIPAWLRKDQAYSRLNILDVIQDMGYNVSNKSREGLIYCRVGQIVARDIIILRKS